MPRTSADDFWRMAVYGETFFDRNHDRRNERDEVARAYVIGRVAAIRFVLLPRRAPENHHAFAAHLPHRYQADLEFTRVCPLHDGELRSSYITCPKPVLHPGRHSRSTHN